MLCERKDKHYHLNTYEGKLCFNTVDEKEDYYNKHLRKRSNYYPERIVALVRDSYRCRNCGFKGYLVVHHLDESRRLGEDKMNNDLNNLITLCKPCHAQIHCQTK